MKTTLVALVTTLVTGTAAFAQDTSFARMWEAAQRLKPARVTSVERIASVSEPGTPMTVRGIVLDAAGRPAANVDVFAYQTDNTGL